MDIQPSTLLAARRHWPVDSHQLSSSCFSSAKILFWCPDFVSNAILSVDINQSLIGLCILFQCNHYAEFRPPDHQIGPFMHANVSFSSLLSLTFLFHLEKRIENDAVECQFVKKINFFFRISYTLKLFSFRLSTCVCVCVHTGDWIEPCKTNAQVNLFSQRITILIRTPVTTIWNTKRIKKPYGETPWRKCFGEMEKEGLPLINMIQLMCWQPDEQALQPFHLLCS